MFDALGFLVAIAIIAPAIVFGIQKSTWIIDYLFVVVAFNRCIRRMVDYHNGSFNPFSLISLTPMIVSGIATLVVLIELIYRRESFGATAARVTKYYIIAVAMAFVVGFFNAQLAAVYSLGDFIAPIGLIGFGAWHSDDSKVINRWCQNVALTAFAVGAYGIWQFYTIPPWDGFWLVKSGMAGYMGSPEPQKMTLFSTMNERGPTATYLCSGVTLLVLRPGTLRFLRWPLVAVTLYAMLLTYSRTAIIQASLAIALYPLLNRGAGILTTLFVLVVLVTAGPQLISMMPGSAHAKQRVATLGNIGADSSFQGRITFLGSALRNAAGEPFGIGIGAHGMAHRVNKAKLEGTGDSTGYLTTLRTFGWIGFGLVVAMIWQCWQSARKLVVLDPYDETNLLFRAWFISGMISMFSGDWMFTATYFWVLAGYALKKADILGEQEEQDLEYIDEDMAPQLISN